MRGTASKFRVFSICSPKRRNARLFASRKGVLEKLADVVISRRCHQNPVPIQNAASVGIDYKNGMFACVEKDGVSGFRADSVKVEELIAEDRGRR